MASRSKGYAVKTGGFFLTRKGEFFPLCDTTAIFSDKGGASNAAVDRLGRLLPETVKFEVVPVSRVWVEVGA